MDQLFLVAAGKTQIGSGSFKVNLPEQVVQNGLRTIQEMLNLGIEKMMPSSDPLPVVLVGGGAILAPAAAVAGALARSRRRLAHPTRTKTPSLTTSNAPAGSTQTCL